MMSDANVCPICHGEWKGSHFVEECRDAVVAQRDLLSGVSAKHAVARVSVEAERDRLAQQLREADEQCHVQVAASVREREEALAIAGARTKQWVQAVTVTDKLRQEYAGLKQQLADAMQTIHDQAEIIERLEARK